MNYLAPLISFLVSLALIATLLSSRIGKKIQDIPNERSLHTTPTPRIGGLGLIAGVLAGWGFLFPALNWWLLLPLFGLVAISLLDDIYNLSVKWRLLMQIAAAAMLVVGAGLLTSQGVWIALVLLLFAVWMTNLYNFMDGSNGLAGGMALFGFGFYGVAALLARNEAFAVLNFSISAAALGFLFFNFPKAKIFLGDAGSIPLGFLAAALGLWGWQQGTWSVWFPLFVFSPFIVDASITLFKRALRRVKVTEAHREHYYQRAIQMGWSHYKLALVEYVLMLISGTVALLCRSLPFPASILLLCGGGYAVLMLSLDVAWKKYTRGQHA